VPQISRFYGIVITMYYDDHGGPHFHARYAEHNAKIAIKSGAVLRGLLPQRALRLVREWAGIHRDELEENWLRARSDESLMKIEPLP
jgi:Domain of unknown function (DUF4160)